MAITRATLHALIDALPASGFIEADESLRAMIAYWTVQDTLPPYVPPQPLRFKAMVHMAERRRPMSYRIEDEAL
jgi:hypothetical protein